MVGKCRTNIVSLLKHRLNI